MAACWTHGCSSELYCLLAQIRYAGGEPEKFPCFCVKTTLYWAFIYMTSSPFHCVTFLPSKLNSMPLLSMPWLCFLFFIIYWYQNPFFRTVFCAKLITCNCESSSMFSLSVFEVNDKKQCWQPCEKTFLCLFPGAGNPLLLFQLFSSLLMTLAFLELCH